MYSLSQQDMKKEKKETTLQHFCEDTRLKGKDGLKILIYFQIYCLKQYK